MPVDSKPVHVDLMLLPNMAKGNGKLSGKNSRRGHGNAWSLWSMASELWMRRDGEYGAGSRKRNIGQGLVTLQHIPVVLRLGLVLSTRASQGMAPALCAEPCKPTQTHM